MNVFYSETSLKFDFKDNDFRTIKMHCLYIPFPRKIVYKECTEAERQKILKEILEYED